jgi:hypothetical protein
MFTGSSEEIIPLKKIIQMLYLMLRAASASFVTRRQHELDINDGEHLNARGPEFRHLRASWWFGQLLDDS